MTMIAPTPPPQSRQVSVSARNVYAVEGVWVPEAMRVNRAETSHRKEVQELEHKSFGDLLFSIALMLGDIRKVRAAEHPKNVWTYSLKSLTQIEQDHQTRHERDVWFPPAVPRGVPSPPRPIKQLIPRQSNPEVEALLLEEAELREWVTRLEGRLRQPVERGCVDSWLLITGPQRTFVEESESRAELAEEEGRSWKAITNRHKHLLPASYFTDIANAKRAAARQAILDNPVSGEALLRQELEAEEHAAKAELFGWLHEKYGVRLYSTSRIEVSLRSEIEEDAEENSVTKLAFQYCEEKFRCSRLALLCLHTAPSKPLLVDFIAKCCPEMSL
jgi:hypothetical protein